MTPLLFPIVVSAKIGFQHLWSGMPFPPVVYFP